MTREVAELRQMLSAPSDAYPAGAWCEAANRLLVEVDALSVRLAQAEQERDELQAWHDKVAPMTVPTAREAVAEKRAKAAEVRLRENEEARCRCGAAMDEVHVTRTGVCPTHGVQPVAASGGREAPDTKTDDG